MPIEITDFRLSFIWAQTLLNEKQPGSALFAQRPGYASLFDAARQPGSDGAFCLPWPLAKPYAHRFWVYYLGAGNPSDVDGKTAWLKGVPLRATQSGASVTASWFPGRISVEQYFHPFGTAMAVSFAASGTFKDTEWVDLVINAERQQLEVSLDGAATQPMSLSALAGERLGKARTEHFGKDLPAPQLPQPFTIATVISGDGVDPTVDPPDGGEIHRMLYGAATRLPQYDTAKLGEFKPARLDCRSGAAAGDIVFAAKRGRVTWFPSSFRRKAEPGKAKTSLSCYHRNQFFAALQAESLCSLTPRLADHATKPHPRQWITEFEPLPAQMLADMHDGAATTYRSASLQRQIEDSGVKDGIVMLRQRSGLAEWPDKKQQA